MFTITLNVSRTETWRPEITIPEKDRKAFAHMSDEQAAEYVLKLADEMSDYVFDEYRHKATLETYTDIEIVSFNTNLKRN